MDPSQVLRDLARSRGYSCLKELKPGKAYQLAKGDQRFVLKRTRPAGLAAMRDTLPRLSPELSAVLPEFVEGCETEGIGCWTIYRWCEGRDFCARWSVSDARTAGGRVLDARNITPVLDLLGHLAARRPEVGLVSTCIRLQPAPLRAQIEDCLRLLRPPGWIDDDEERRLAEAVEPMADTIAEGHCMLTNGDFQFRNFIERPDGTFLLLDWDYARYSSYEIEHCVSYQWLLMWNNSDWQREFLSRAQRRFSIEASRFRAAFLRNALLRLVAWRDDPALRDVARSKLKTALSDAKFDRFWHGG